MKFKDCRQCGNYKYIQHDGLCPSCFTEWVVIFRVPHGASRPEIIQDGLSKREAKEEARESTHLIAQSAK